DRQRGRNSGSQRQASYGCHGTWPRGLTAKKSPAAQHPLRFIIAEIAAILGLFRHGTSAAIRPGVSRYQDTQPMRATSTVCAQDMSMTAARYLRRFALGAGARIRRR